MKSIPHLGKRIRALRLHEGLSQTALAERLGVSTSYLNLIEHDRRPISANLLIRLAQFTVWISRASARARTEAGRDL